MNIQRGTGWLVKLYDEPQQNIGYHAMSDDFHYILTQTRSAGYRMVEFDSGAIKYEYFALKN